MADETTRGLRIFGVDINGARNRLPHSCQHLELNITHRVDGVSAQHFQDLCGAGIPVACMSGNLEMAILRNLTGFTHLIQYPQATFVIDQESTAAKPCGALYILDGSDDLLLSTQTITHPHAFFRVDRGGGIGRCTGADCKNQVGLILMGKVHHLGDILIRQAHDALGLGNTMEIQAIAVHCLQKSLHNLRSLNAGNLKAVLTTISKPFGAGRQIIGIASRLSDRLQELSCFVHAVHFFLFLSATLWHIF